MRDAHKITEVTISTMSTEPLRGTVEINTATNSTMKFELSEDMAHHLSTQLDRFLTQRRQLRERLARSR
jgi:hypothetical protein